MSDIAKIDWAAIERRFLLALLRIEAADAARASIAGYGRINGIATPEETLLMSL